MRVRTIKNKRQPHLRQPDKEVSRNVDFVRQNPMLVQDADKLEFVEVTNGKNKNRIA